MNVCRQMLKRVQHDKVVHVTLNLFQGLLEEKNKYSQTGMDVLNTLYTDKKACATLNKGDQLVTLNVFQGLLEESKIVSTVRNGCAAFTRYTDKNVCAT